MYDEFLSKVSILGESLNKGCRLSIYYIDGPRNLQIKYKSKKLDKVLYLNTFILI